MKLVAGLIATLMVTMAVAACQPAADSGQTEATAPAESAAPTEGAMAMDQDSEATPGEGEMASDSEGEMHDENESGDEHADGYTFGEPGDPAESSRVIDITALDTFVFEPNAVEVAVGETVTFHVTNAGTTEHEFTLGDAAHQDEHELEMQEMAGTMMMDEPNAIRVEPGQTKDVVWHFTTAGEVFYGCHTPGHYASGMVGTISVK